MMCDTLAVGKWPACLLGAWGTVQKCRLAGFTRSWAPSECSGSVWPPIPKTVRLSKALRSFPSLQPRRLARQESQDPGIRQAVLPVAAKWGPEQHSRKDGEGISMAH